MVLLVCDWLGFGCGFVHARCYGGLNLLVFVACCVDLFTVQFWFGGFAGLLCLCWFVRYGLRCIGSFGDCVVFGYI